MITQHTDQLEDLFACRGLRCTQQRRAVYDCLTSSTAHPTAEQLFHEVGGRVQGISLATVYNTLEAFCKVGMAKKLSGKGGSVRYDALVHNHVHTYCQKTGAIHDVPDEMGRKLHKCITRKCLKAIEEKLGFTVHHVQIDLIGEYGNGY